MVGHVEELRQTEPPNVATAPRLTAVDEELRRQFAEPVDQDAEFWSSPKRDRRESIHSLFQYPAMMVPIVQRQLIQMITRIQPGVNLLLDPFVGAGTTLVSGMHCGLSCYGQDINPLAILLCRVKLGPFPSTHLSQRVLAVCTTAKQDTSTDIDVTFPNRDKWFQSQVAIELTRLQRAIRREEDLWTRRFFWAILAETVRLTGNDRTSTYKLHARPAEEIAKRDVSPLGMFTVLINRNVADLNAHIRTLEQAGQLHDGQYVGDVRVDLTDTGVGIIRASTDHNTYDLVVTSPPYGDNTSTVPYGQHSYLPLQWIDLADIDPLAETGGFLRTQQEIDRRSLGGHQPKNLPQTIKELGQRSVALADTFRTLAAQPPDRAARVAAFYADFDNSLEHIINAISPNAYLLWTVGNRQVGGMEIPNDQILTELLGLRQVLPVAQLERTILYKRMAIRNKIAPTMGDERILLFRKNVDTERLA